MKIKSKIVEIGIVQEISQTFRKRQLILETIENYPQTLAIEFKQLNCGLLDAHFCKQDQAVEVSINLKGRKWKNPQTKEIRYFNSIEGWRINEAVEEVAVGAQSPDREDDLPF